MSDKAWLLNPEAMRAARQCIKVVGETLGVRLTLTHPDFFEMVESYAELSDCEELSAAYRALDGFAHPGKKAKPKNVVRFASKQQTQAVPTLTEKADGASQDELISVGGKDYQRFSEGKEFKGLYRGAPTYA